MLKIGWDEVGELPVAAGEPAGTKSQSKSKTTGKRKKRGKKKKEEEEFDDEDESDEEPVPTADVIVDCLSEDESGAEEDMTQYYRVLDRPRRGKERYWRRVDSGGTDDSDNSRLQIVAVCRGDDDGLLYFKYYDVNRYAAGPPAKSEVYDYTVCEEMDPPKETENCWMQWDPLPDPSCIEPAAGGATIGRPPSGGRGMRCLPLRKRRSSVLLKKLRPRLKH